MGHTKHDISRSEGRAVRGEDTRRGEEPHPPTDTVR
ncbi:MAG: hypothetical protein JWM10_166 [Myxococcaceae bacterium]|nr:hypothetical protein [Myxococcaceae bacterium]